MGILSTFARVADPFKAGTHSGLDFAYGKGRVRDGVTITDTAAGTVTLTDATTNYIEVDPSDGTVSANTTGFTSGRIPLFEVVCSGGAIDTVTDKRVFFVDTSDPSFSDLDEAPSDMTGNAGKQLQVNDGETALEYVSGTKNLVAYIGGELDTTANDAEIKTRYVIGSPFSIDDVSIEVDVAPVGADLIVDVLKNGTSIFNVTPANRPTITDGNTSGTSGTPDTTSLASGDVIEFQVTQVGSTTPGSRLSITMTMLAT